MRLTLRALLNYMDRILEGEDAQEIGRKIEESEFATNLKNRIQEVTRRLRLSAPSVTDRGPGLDPNTVAEYLDCVLPADRVPDFEKVCLESDTHLAEVASCHQILAIVLGEPVVVEDASRQRMHTLSEAAAAGEAAAAPKAVLPVQPEAAPPVQEDAARRPQREKPAVPAYLRDPTPRRRPLLAVVAGLAVVVLVAALGLAYFGQFQSHSALARWMGLGGPSPAANAPDAESKASAPAATPAVPVAKPEVPAAKPSPVAGAPAKPEPGPAAKPAEGKADALTPPLGGTPAASAKSAPEAKPGDETRLPADVAPKAVTTAPPGGPKPATAPAGEPVRVASVAGNVVSPRPKDVPPAGPERVGRFVDDKEVLLRYDVVTGEWQRVEPQGVINTSVPLLALPPYRPQISLTGDTTLRMNGGARLELLSGDAAATNGLHVTAGRLTLRSVGEVKARLRLKVGNSAGVVTLKSADTTLAIDVARIRRPGDDPEKRPGPLSADLYAVGGDFVWEEPGREPLTVPKGSTVRLAGDFVSRPQPLEEPPHWIANDESTYLDRRAAPLVEQTLQVGRSVVLGLRELADVNQRQREVKGLAVRSLGYVGDFEPMVAALNDVEQRTVWEDFLQHLQLMVNRGPDVASSVRQALSKQYPKDAAALYRMLWGYSDKDLRNPDAPDVQALVLNLRSETLACRVVAFQILNSLTGATYSYNPRDPEPKRQVPTTRWEQRLKTGLLTLKGAEPKKKPPADDTPVAPIPPE